VHIVDHIEASGAGVNRRRTAPSNSDMTPRLPLVLVPLLVVGAARAEEPVMLTMGYVFDPDRPAVYMMNARRGIDAVHPRTGRPLWKTSEAAVPLIAHQGRLLALREPTGAKSPHLELVILDAAKGRLRTALAPIALPPWVSPTVGRGRGFSFSVAARLTNVGAVVSWRARSWYWGGRAPSPEEERAARREVAGEVTVDLGAATVREGGPAPPAPAPGGPFEVNGITVEIVAAGPDLVMKRTRAGVALPDVVVGQAVPLRVHPIPSADRRHLLVIKQLDQDARGKFRYRWSLYTTETGRRLAEHVTTGLFGPFVVWRGRMLLVLGGAQLRASDPRSGRVAFSRKGRALDYGGGPPP
jgi:hypothetical protein